MDFETALALEVRRLSAVAAGAGRLIAGRRPWWAGAVDFLREVLL